MAQDSFETSYKRLKDALSDIGFSVNSGNLAKFSCRVNNVDIFVAVYIPTQKPLFKIGKNFSAEETIYTDDIYQYQIWAVKGNDTVYSIGGAGQGSLNVTDITTAAKSAYDKYK